MSAATARRLVELVGPVLELRLHRIGTFQESTARLIAGAELIAQMLELGETLEGTCWALRGELGLRTRPE